MTRHGAGPLPTWNRELDARLADPGNPTNAWQGTIRRGWLDIVLLRYAAETAGGPLDGLVIDCLDHLADITPQICVSYSCPPDAAIEQLPVSPVPWLAAQSGSLHCWNAPCLFTAKFLVPDCRDRLARTVAPIAITGTGPTWQEGLSAIAIPTARDDGHRQGRGGTLGRIGLERSGRTGGATLFGSFSIRRGGQAEK